MKDRYYTSELDDDLLEDMAQFYEKHSRSSIEQSRSNVRAIINHNVVDFYPYWIVRMIQENETP